MKLSLEELRRRKLIMFGSDKTKKQAMQKQVAKNVMNAKIRNNMIKAEKADKGKNK